MNWGHGVIIILIFFFIGLGFMVFVSMRQNIEMIDDQYYDKELKYQGIIDAKNNLALLNDSVFVAEGRDVITIKMPQGAHEDISGGTLEFLRPSDKTLDRVVAIETDSSGSQLLPKAEFKNGIYRMRASWKSGGKDYFYEKDILLK